MGVRAEAAEELLPVEAWFQFAGHLLNALDLLVVLEGSVGMEEDLVFDLYSLSSVRWTGY